MNGPGRRWNGIAETTRGGSPGHPGQVGRRRFGAGRARQIADYRGSMVKSKLVIP